MGLGIWGLCGDAKWTYEVTSSSEKPFNPPYSSSHLTRTLIYPAQFFVVVIIGGGRAGHHTIPNPLHPKVAIEWATCPDPRCNSDDGVLALSRPYLRVGPGICCCLRMKSYQRICRTHKASRQLFQQPSLTIHLALSRGWGEGKFPDSCLFSGYPEATLPLSMSKHPTFGVRGPFFLRTCHTPRCLGSSCWLGLANTPV